MVGIARPGVHGDVLTPDLLPARPANDCGVEIVITRLVVQDDRDSAVIARPAIAPRVDRGDDAEEVLPFLCELIVVPDRILLVGLAHDDSAFSEGAQSFGQGGTGDPESGDQPVESGFTVKQLA